MFLFMQCIAKDVLLRALISLHEHKSPKTVEQPGTRKWGMLRYKQLCVGTGPAADVETTQPPAPMVTNILDIRFDMASPSAVSLAGAPASGCVFRAEIDVCGSPGSK